MAALAAGRHNVWGGARGSTRRKNIRPGEPPGPRGAPATPARGRPARGAAARAARRARWPGRDGPRARAVVAVLLCHAGLASVPGGFLGVEVFFVISGYL